MHTNDHLPRRPRPERSSRAARRRAAWRRSRLQAAYGAIATAAAALALDAAVRATTSPDADPGGLALAWSAVVLAHYATRQR